MQRRSPLFSPVRRILSTSTINDSLDSPAALTILKIVHQLVLKPFYLSPMRKAPGPSTSPKSLRYILFGEFPDIMRAEAGILQRQWAKEYGPVVRAVGPFGIERMMFLSPSAMQKILVSDWVEYPRVSGSISFLLLTTTQTHRKFLLAGFHEKHPRDGSWIWSVDCHGR